MTHYPLPQPRSSLGDVVCDETEPAREKGVRPCHLQRGAQTTFGMVPIAIVVCTAMITAGCRDDYLDRSDTNVLSHGEAVTRNKIIQTRNPWPAVAHRKHYPTDGERVRHAVDRYREKPRTPATQQPVPVAPSQTQ